METDADLPSVGNKEHYFPHQSLACGWAAGVEISYLAGKLPLCLSASLLSAIQLPSTCQVLADTQHTLVYFIFLTIL